MTTSQIARIGKQLNRRLDEIEKRGRRSTDSIQTGKLREQWKALKDARDALRRAYVATLEVV